MFNIGYMRKCKLKKNVLDIQYNFQMLQTRPEIIVCARLYDDDNNDNDDVDDDDDDDDSGGDDGSIIYIIMRYCNVL